MSAIPTAPPCGRTDHFASTACPYCASIVTVTPVTPYFGQGQTPHKCPVCNGTKLVSTPPGVAGDLREFVGSEAGPWPCRICDGTGILWR